MLKMTIDLNDTYVKRWLNGLSAKTKKNYPNEFGDWLTFINLSPTEQINKRMHDLTSTEITERCFFEDNWRSYKEALKSTGLNSDSKVHDKIKVVSSFFTRNGLPLNLKKGDWKSTQKQEVLTPKFKLDLDNIKRMYGHANLRDKCLLLGLSQSGFSEIDLSAFHIEDIKDLYVLPVNEHYQVEKPRDKTNQVQATCLSYEFLHDLKDLLAERGNPKKGYLFTSQTKQDTEGQLSKEEKAKLSKDDLKKYEETQAKLRADSKEKGLNNIGVRQINESMKNLAVRTFGEEKAKEFQTKQLRSFYNSALLRAKIQPQEIKDLMMGHARLGARGHYDYDSETIKEAYLMAFEYLSINGIQSRADLTKIKENLNALIGSQQVEIETRKAERKTDLERIGKLEDFIKTNTTTDPKSIRKIVLEAIIEHERMKPEKIILDKT